MQLSPKNRVIKNLIAINVAFLLVFAALNNVLAIQSVLNKDEGLGTAGQLTIFVVQLFTCLVISQVMIDKIGFKWTLAFAQFTYAVYVAANAYPTWYTIIPTAALSGFGNSLSWNVLGIYIANLSMDYARLTNKSYVTVQHLFFGIFTAIFLGASVIGSALVATILKTDDLDADLSNFSYAKTCGAFNCPNDDLPVSASDPTKTSVYIFLGLLIILNILGILTTLFFMDNIKVDKSSELISEVSEYDANKSIATMFKEEFIGIFKLMGYLDTYLLIPMTIFTGYQLTFIWSEYNRAFVTCLTSINYIGWTNIFFGFTGAIFSILFGYIEKYTTQFPQILFIFTLSIGEGVFIVSWTPEPVSGIYVIFLIVLVVAIVESIATAQIRGLYGVQFPGIPAAFNIATIAQTLGFIGGFLMSLFFCVIYKIYVFIALALISLVTGTILFSRNQYKKSNKVQIDHSNQEENDTNKDENKNNIKMITF